MSGLDDLDNDLLPLNRKERFYTGTVLPGIVCADGMTHLDKFLALIPGCPRMKIDGSSESANVQFFTEYNLTESVAVGRAAASFSDRPMTGDTPDVLIALSGPLRVLIAIEAKVFDAVSANDLRSQMDRQKKNVLDYLAAKRAFDLAGCVRTSPTDSGSKCVTPGVLTGSLLDRG